MDIKVYQNRETKKMDTEVYGTQNENNITILKIEVPEQYKNWNKRIVFITEEKKFWDIITNDAYIIKNNITKYKEVDAYIWLTENAEAERESVGDFRSKTFTLSFFDNEDADDVTPSETQVDGFNSILTVLNAEIEEVRQLENTLETAEQERIQAEILRNQAVADAVANIEDLTEEYNENAMEKTEEFNDNAVEKTDGFNENAEEKKQELNTIADGVKDMATALQLATFDIDDEMQLGINTAEKLANTSFNYNEETGELEVEIV